MILLLYTERTFLVCAHDVISKTHCKGKVEREGFISCPHNSPLPRPCSGEDDYTGLISKIFFSFFFSGHLWDPGKEIAALGMRVFLHVQSQGGWDGTVLLADCNLHGFSVSQSGMRRHSHII